VHRIFVGTEELKSTRDDAPGGTATWRKIATTLVVVAILLVVGRRVGAVLPQFVEWVQGLGAWAPIAFVAGYVLAAIAFVPGALLTLGGGAIFGLARGTLYVFVAASLGACAAFLIARYAARELVERKLATDARFAAIDRAVAREGRKIVFLLRLSPLFPYNLLNYALGLTNVSFLDYALGCFGMLPGTFLYVYSGKVAGDVAAAAAGVSPSRGAAEYAMVVVGLLATIAVTALITRAARRALADVSA